MNQPLQLFGPICWNYGVFRSWCVECIISAYWLVAGFSSLLIYDPTKIVLLLVLTTFVLSLCGNRFALAGCDALRRKDSLGLLSERFWALQSEFVIQEVDCPSVCKDLVLSPTAPDKLL